MFRSIRQKFSTRDGYPANTNRSANASKQRQRSPKSYWTIVATDGPVTQQPDPRSTPTGVVAKGGKILIVDETPYNFKIIKPCRGWISRDLVQHNCGWFSLTRDVAVVSQSRSSAPIKTLFGATLVHVCAVYEKCVVIDEPVYGKFNCSQEEKALLPIDLHKGWYDVRRACTVRVDRFRQSARVHTLRPKDKVQVVEVRDEAVRISHPRPGWVSLLSHEKKPVLVPVESEIRIGSWHEVLIDTYVYKQISAKSRRIGSVKRGDRVFVTERIGKSNRIDKPMRGWVRSITTDGYAILRYEQPRGVDDVDITSLDIDTFWDFVAEKKRRSRTSVVVQVSENNKPAASVPTTRRFPSTGGERKRSSGADRKRSSNADRKRSSLSFQKKRQPETDGLFGDRAIHARTFSGYAHEEGRRRTDSRAHTITRGWYIIRIYTLITATEDKESKWVRSAKPGDKVHVDHSNDIRAYIDRPCKGWISLKTNSGKNVVEPIISSIIEESEDGDDTTSRNYPERDASSETVDDDYDFTDSTETLTDDDEAGRDWIGALGSDTGYLTRARGASTLSQYKNPSMVLVGDSVVIRGRQGTVVGMKEDDTATLLSVQLDGDEVAQLINEAEVLPIELTLSKQLDLQLEMDELMGYFRESAVDMKRRQSVASSYIESKSDTFFDRMKNGGLLWESAIPEDSVLDDSSEISKLTGLPGDQDAPASYDPLKEIKESPSFGGTDFSSQDEVDAMLQPLPPEKKLTPRRRGDSGGDAFASASPQKKLEKKNLTGTGKKYTRSRSNLGSNSSRDSGSKETQTSSEGTIGSSSFAGLIAPKRKLPMPKQASPKKHRPSPSQTPSLSSSVASSSNYSRGSLPLERKSIHKGRPRKSSTEVPRPTKRSTLRTVSEETPLEDPSPRHRGMTSLEKQQTQLQLQMSKMKQIAELTQQISDLTSSGGSPEEIKRTSDQLMRKLKQLMGESTTPSPRGNSRSRGTKGREQVHRASVESVEFEEKSSSTGDNNRSRSTSQASRVSENPTAGLTVNVRELAKKSNAFKNRGRKAVASPRTGVGAYETPKLSMKVTSDPLMDSSRSTTPIFELPPVASVVLEVPSPRRIEPSPARDFVTKKRRPRLEKKSFDKSTGSKKRGADITGEVSKKLEPVKEASPMKPSKELAKKSNESAQQPSKKSLEKASKATIEKPSKKSVKAKQSIEKPLPKKSMEKPLPKKLGKPASKTSSAKPLEKKSKKEASPKKAVEKKVVEKKAVERPLEKKPLGESNRKISIERMKSPEKKKVEETKLFEATPEKQAIPRIKPLEKKASPLESVKTEEVEQVKPINLDNLKKWQAIFQEDDSDFESSSISMSKSPGTMLSPQQLKVQPVTRSRANTPSNKRRLFVDTSGESTKQNKAVSTLLNESGELKARLEALKNVAGEGEPVQKTGSSSLENSTAADLLAQLNDLMADGDEKTGKKSTPTPSPDQNERKIVKKESITRAQTKSRNSISGESEEPVQTQKTAQPVKTQKKRKSKIQEMRDFWEVKSPPRKKAKPNTPKETSPKEMLPKEVSPKETSPKEKEPKPASILKRSSSNFEQNSPKSNQPKKSVTFNPTSKGLLPDNVIEELLTKSGDEAKKTKKKKTKEKSNQKKEKAKERQKEKLKQKDKVKQKENQKHNVNKENETKKPKVPSASRAIISNKRKRRSKKMSKLDLIPTTTDKPPVTTQKPHSPKQNPLEPVSQAKPKVSNQKSQEQSKPKHEKTSPPRKSSKDETSSREERPISPPRKSSKDETSSREERPIRKSSKDEPSPQNVLEDEEEAARPPKMQMNLDMIKNGLKGLKAVSPTPKEPEETDEEHILDVIARTRGKLKKTKTRESKIFSDEPKNQVGDSAGEGRNKFGRKLGKGEITLEMVKETRNSLRETKTNKAKDYKIGYILKRTDPPIIADYDNASDASTISSDGDVLDWDYDKMKQREKLQVVKKRKSRVGKLISGFQKTHKRIREEAESTGSLSPNYPCPYCNEKIHIGDKVHYGPKAKWHSRCWKKKLVEDNPVRYRALSNNIDRGGLCPPTETAEQFNKIIKKRHRRGPSLSICGKCKKQVFLNDECTYFGRVLWHRTCFRCENCNRIFGANEDWWTQDERPWCQKCFRECFPDAVAPMTQYESETPVAILKFEPSSGMKEVFYLIRRGSVLYSTMRINGPQIIPYFWRLWRGDLEMMPAEDQIDFEALRSIKVPRKVRNAITTQKVFDEFIGALTLDGPSFGTLAFTFRLGDHGRIFDKLVLFFWLPPTTTISDKVLYGTAKGALPDMGGFQATITTQRLEDLEYNNVKRMLAGV